MIFYTVSHSAYEVDYEKKRIRRLRGEGLSTNRIGDDGAWRQYAKISAIVENAPVLIVWSSNTPLHDGSDPNSIPTTLTSDVDNIHQDEN